MASPGAAATQPESTFLLTRQPLRNAPEAFKLVTDIVATEPGSQIVVLALGSCRSAGPPPSKMRTRIVLRGLPAVRRGELLLDAPLQNIHKIDYSKAIPYGIRRTSALERAHYDACR